MFKPKKVNSEIESLEKQRADILTNFDFKTTAMIMASPCKPIWDENYENIVGYEPWTMWCGDRKKVFNEGELRQLAKRLLDDVIKNNTGKINTIATGPFKAIYRFGILELDFVMESWSVD